MAETRRHRGRGHRRLGRQPGAQLRVACRARGWPRCATPIPSGSRDRRPSYPRRARAWRDVEDVARDPDVQAVVVVGLGGQPLPARQHAARGRQGRLRREAAGARGRRTPRSWCGWPREHDRILMVGHLLLYHPGGPLPQGAWSTSGELGDLLLHLFAAREPRQGAARRERAVELRAARPVGDPAPARAWSRSTWWRAARRSCRARSRTWCSSTCASRAARWRTCTSSWLDPHKLRKFTVVGSQKMVVFDDMEASEKIRDLRQGRRSRRARSCRTATR
mgnify:CR=1 FL=1